MCGARGPLVPLVWRGLRRVHDLPVLGVAGFVPGLKPRPTGPRLIGDCGPPPLAQKQQRAKDGPPTHSLFTVHLCCYVDSILGSKEANQG